MIEWKSWQQRLNWEVPLGHLWHAAVSSKSSNPHHLVGHPQICLQTQLCYQKRNEFFIHSVLSPFIFGCWCLFRWLLVGGLQCLLLHSWWDRATWNCRIFEHLPHIQIMTRYETVCCLQVKIFLKNETHCSKSNVVSMRLEHVSETYFTLV